MPARFDILIGVGGIGAGMFVELRGNRTLGREESRAGRLLDRRDACKLHIIAHHVRRLLGPSCRVLPAGCVGADESGRRVLDEMRAAGLDVSCVETVPDAPTLFSVCLLYPDGSGGNVTTDDSACSRVDTAFVARLEPEFRRHAGRGIALAAPEVPLAARAALLALATRHNFWRVAAFTAAEMPEALGLLRQVDLLVLNRSEAAAVAGVPAEGAAPAVLAEAAVARVRREQPAIVVAVTASREGSWLWDGAVLHHQPAAQVGVAGTAGAGDAFTGALIAGHAAGLAWPDCQQLAALVAGVAIQSPHTINPDLDGAALRALAARGPGWPVRVPVDAFLASLP